MADMALDGGPLAGKRVAFTGRLASMTRNDAAGMVRWYGGEFELSVTRRTSWLVVGQEGWPLRKDGRLAAKLLQARRLQQTGHAIEVIPEEELLSRLDLAPQSQGIYQIYTLAQLSQFLDIPGERIRSWVEIGLIRPVHVTQGVSFFDFQQVSSARMLCDLIRAGVPPDRVRHSLKQIRSWLPDLEQPLAQLSVLEQTGRLFVRLQDGRLAEPSGQLCFDFNEAHAPTAGQVEPVALSADDYFELGCGHEAAGHLTEAEAAYREALLVGGPDANACFNLANVLYALGRSEQAAERFRQVVEIEPRHAEAWNNLGNVLAERGEPHEAVSAYREALEAEPAYPDAQYNLADTLQEMGLYSEALPHWRAYLQHDHASRWAEFARGSLAQGT